MLWMHTTRRASLVKTTATQSNFSSRSLDGNMQSELNLHQVPTPVSSWLSLFPIVIRSKSKTFRLLHHRHPSTKETSISPCSVRPDPRLWDDAHLNITTPQHQRTTTTRDWRFAGRGAPKFHLNCFPQSFLHFRLLPTSKPACPRESHVAAAEYNFGW